MVAKITLIFGVFGIIYCLLWITRMEKNKKKPDSGFIGFRAAEEFQKKYKDTPPY